MSVPLQVQQLIGAEQIRETREEESWFENDNYYAKKIKKDLQQLYNTREKVKCHLQNIEKEIENMEKHLQTPITQGRAMLIERLLKAEKLAIFYSNITLKKFSDLRIITSSNVQEIEIFMIEVEGWLEQISDAIRYNNLSFLDCSNPSLCLLNSSEYKNVGVKVYNKLFDVIKEDLSRNLPEEVKNDLFECVDFLKNEVLRFV